MSAVDPLDPTSEGGRRRDRLAGRYTLGARRSRGPATDVHPGWDHARERPITVELYRTDARPAHRYRREREVAALAGLDHPAVLAVLDRGRDPATGRAYVVTRALDGITLAARIRRGPQDLVRVLALGGVVAGALAHLHAAGMVHRRLTPSTITMDRYAGPVLHDLDGIATLDVEPITLEEAVALGDAVYLAPEQIAGRDVGPTADVYSLARILEACLATPATHVRADPATPLTRTPDAVRALLAAMTDPDPERRLGASRVVDELGALRVAARSAPPVAAAPPITTASPVAARSAPPVTAATPDISDGSGTPTRRRPPRDEPDRLRVPGPPHRPRRRAGFLAAVVLGLGIELAALGAGAASAGSPPPTPDPPAATP